MTRLLVVDDESLILDSFRFAFPMPDYEVITATTGRQALDLFTVALPDVVVCDIKLPDMTGIDLFRKLHALDPKIPIILMTGHGTAGTAIDAMRAGAFEYVLKPLDPDTLIPLVESAAETSRLMRVPAQLPAGEHFGSVPVDSADILIGSCPAMQEVYRAIGRVAPQNVTVLILGESGTGKEVVARAIYNYSQRSEKPFPEMIFATPPAHQNSEDAISGTLVAAESLPDEVVLATNNHDDRTTDWDAVVAKLLASRSESIYDETLHIMERSVICRVLRHTRGNQQQAARLLGLSRATLRVKCRSLGITIETVVGEG